MTATAVLSIASITSALGIEVVSMYLTIRNKTVQTVESAVSRGISMGASRARGGDWGEGRTAGWDTVKNLPSPQPRQPLEVMI